MSAYIDFAQRLKTEDLDPVFDCKKKLMPRPSDLSFYNWETQTSTSNATPNFQVSCGSICKKVAIEADTKKAGRRIGERFYLKISRALTSSTCGSSEELSADIIDRKIVSEDHFHMICCSSWLYTFIDGTDLKVSP